VRLHASKPCNDSRDSVSSLFVILRTPNRCYMGRTTVISCDIHLDLLAGIGLQDRQADGYESLPKGVQGRHMPFRFYILSQPISRPRGVSSTPYLTWRRIHATTGGNSDSPRISAPAILQKPVSSFSLAQDSSSSFSTGTTQCSFSQSVNWSYSSCGMISSS